MKNLMLIETDNMVLVTKKLESLNKNNYPIEYIDMNNYSLDDIVVNLDTYNFLEPNRIVVLSNIEKALKEDSSNFEKYIENPNTDNYLVIVSNNLDQRKKIVKSIKKYFEVVEVTIDPNTYIKDHLDSYSMDYKAILELVDRTNGNISSIDNELDKLKLLKLEDKVITIDDVIDVVYRNINDNDDYIFDFVDAIIKKNTTKALNIYEDLKELNVEVFSLIGLVSSQVRSLIQVSILKDKTDKEISDELKMHPYRVKKLRESACTYKFEDLEKIMSKLYDMDFSIKSGKIDGTLAMELFIVN